MSQPGKLPTAINWIGYAALTLLLLLPLSVIMVRSGAWQQGLLLYALTCLGSGAFLSLAIVLMLLPRLAPWRAAIGRRALLTLPGTAALFVATLGTGDYPPIHDITTDTRQPPQFVRAPELRGEHSNPLQIEPETIEQQRAAYPDIQTLRTDLSIDAAYAKALQTVRQLGWEVYHEDSAAGIIEAVDTTPIMAFRDDIVLRVRGNADGAYIDLRSVSRVGKGDLGANARRIRDFSGAFSSDGG